MIQGFHVEMGRGLSGDESSLKMIPSFIDKPKGNEVGEFLTLDLEGTNFRVLTVRLDRKGNASVPFAGKFAIPQKDMQGQDVILLLNEALRRKDISCICFFTCFTANPFFCEF